jgi:hypothetical protein
LQLGPVILHLLPLEQAILRQVLGHAVARAAKVAKVAEAAVKARVKEKAKVAERRKRSPRVDPANQKLKGANRQAAKVALDVI